MTDLDLTTVPAEEVRKGDKLDIAGIEAMVGAVEASTYSQKATIYDLRHASWVTLPLGTQVAVRRPKPDPDADLLAKLAEVLHERLPPIPADARPLLDAMRAAGITVTLDGE